MPVAASQPGSKWVAVALFSSAALLVLFFALSLRFPATHPAEPPRKQPTSVGLAQLDKPSGDALLREEAFLHDPTPLFLPTEWNASQDIHPENALRQPGDAFKRFPAKFQFGNDSLSLLLPAPVKVPDTPADELALSPWDRPFVGFGRTHLEPAVLPSRSAELEVVSGGDGRLVLSLPMKGLLLPTDSLWQPAEFIVETDASGPIGQPALVKSSGVESVDRLFQDTLRGQWPLISQKGRLGQGLYQITIGP